MTRRIYSGKDFDTLKSEIKSRLSENFPDVSLDFKNDMMVFILDMICYGTESLNYYLDVQANEVFSSTAQLRSTIDRHAAAAGYNPEGAVPASGDLKVRPSEVNDRSIVLEEGHEWLSDRGVRYEVAEDYVWSPESIDWKSITLTQITSRSSIFVSNGDRFQTFILPVGADQYLSYRSVEVFVDGREWIEVDHISDTDSRVFKVSYTSDDPYIEFGDGSVGNVPPSGVEVRVNYGVTRGQDGIEPAGRIDSIGSPVVVSGSSVDFEIDKSTGEMRGGGDPESIESIRAKLPNYRHSDGAVVTRSDVEGLLDSYKDPIYGAVATATAFVATSIDNDIESSNLINSAREIVDDKSQIIEDVVANVVGLSDFVDGLSVEVDDIIDDAEQIIGTDGVIRGHLDEISNRTSNADEQVNSIMNRANIISSIRNSSKNAAKDAQTLSEDVRGEIDSLEEGLEDVITPETKDDIMSLMDSLDEKVRESISLSVSGDVIGSHTQSIISSTETVKGDLNNIDGSLSDIEDNVDDADDKLLQVSSKMSDIRDNTEGITIESAKLNTQIINPWDELDSKLDDLYNHLDDIFSGQCGPNLVTVPILSYDADGFYVSPTEGLKGSFNEYIKERQDPSIVVNVVDGSFQLVKPIMEVTFRLGRGFSANTVKGAIESRLTSELKGRSFGDDLYLDNLYHILESTEGVDYINVSIESYEPEPQDGVSIDDEGNLIVSERRVITKPNIKYFQILPNGSKEEL